MVFRPYTQVIPEFCTTSWVRTSTPLSWGFILPEHRSTPFGSPSSDSRRTHRGPHTPKDAATRRFPYGYPLDTVNLATGQNSLVLFSKSNAGRSSTAFAASSVTRPTDLSLPAFRSLHLPSGVLFSFSSRYYYAIGLGSCLGLEVDAPHLHTRFLTHATRVSPDSPSELPVRGFHPLWRSIPEDFSFVS